MSRVLNDIKLKLGKKFQQKLEEKKKKAMMNQFQLSVNESAERIEELILDVDDNNLNLKNDID